MIIFLIFSLENPIKNQLISWLVTCENIQFRSASQLKNFVHLVELLKMEAKARFHVNLQDNVTKIFNEDEVLSWEQSFRSHKAFLNVLETQR